MDLPGYDIWKTASPPEYEIDQGAPDGAEIPNHKCVNSACWVCGACPICRDRHDEDCEVDVPAHLREDLPPPLEDPEDGSPL